MSDINIRVEGRAGRITLTRPKALNALSHDMCRAIDTALHLWREEEHVALVIIDAEGDKAFCAGGDIAELYETGMRGEYDYGQSFWRDEYRLNALLATYAKPVVSFMQGFTMGGGVGIGCHGKHRVVEESSRIAMPECGIGLVPDVGGSYLLARAPGHLGVYLGTSAARMDAADAIFAGFADHFIPRAEWGDLIELIEASGDVSLLDTHARTPPAAALRARQPEIDRLFAAPTLSGIQENLAREDSEFASATGAAMLRNSPLAMACALEIIRFLQAESADMHHALRMEYRYTHRAMQQGDFLEGIRAAIIDKDRNPKWKFAGAPVPRDAIEAMLAPLGAEGLKFDR